MKKQFNILVVGLGYVGLPLAIAFSKYFNVIGYDINKNRINSLKKKVDYNNEINFKKINKLKTLKFTSKFPINSCNIIIVTLPTPVNKFKKPNLNNLKKFNHSLSKNLNKNDIIIYESTVFPGCTEDVFVPQLEKYSKLKFNKDFFVGYSPERINPGDKKNTLENIPKIISASNNKTLKTINFIYSKIIKAGLVKVKTIKIAEAAKVIENTQRDVNIALINEFSIIFNQLNIDTYQVLKAASTKWNFLNFKPGLVGGHCIGVDPYYLAYIAKKNKINPKLIISGRKLNDNMKNIVLKKLYNSMKFKNLKLKESKLLICGATFKPNCADTRNSQIIEMLSLVKMNFKIVHVYDPMINQKNCDKLLKNHIVNSIKKKYYDAIILAVSHKIFAKEINKINNSKKENAVLINLTENLFLENAIKF